MVSKNPTNNDNTSLLSKKQHRFLATTTKGFATAFAIASAVAIVCHRELIYLSPNSGSLGSVRAAFGFEITTANTTTTTNFSSQEWSSDSEKQYVSPAASDSSTSSSSRPAPAPPPPSSLATLVGLPLHGNVSECCCSFDDIEKTNIETVRPLLEKVVATPFFSHFKVDLFSSCELWDDAPLCMLRECSVCECSEPPSWASEVKATPLTGPDPDCGRHVDDSLFTFVDDRATDGWQQSLMSPSYPSSSMLDDEQLLLGALEGNVGGDYYSDEDDENDVENGNNNAVVVNLKLNPERYTGYAGSSAEKVWSAIHSTNCFQPNQREQQQQQREQEKQQLKEGKNGTEGPSFTTTDAMYCPRLLPAEQRLYNRLISGLHSSISLHIAQSYCLELDPDCLGECLRWGPSPEIARERVLDHPDRVENLYVAFALLLRAVVKAGPAVTAAVPRNDPFFTNSFEEWTQSLLPELTKMAEKCPDTFDESTFLVEPGFMSKRTELQKRFQHLQKIIQCVGCDRCKLWGTLQTLGIGTALRVLFRNDDEKEELNLSRQEAVALVHTLERLSSSLVFAHELGKTEWTNNPSSFSRHVM